MGLLDSKSRIFDTIITDLGKQQIASGKLRIEYASFTDGATFYEKDAASGSSDATMRTYLEAGSLPQDQITFESDDSGHIKPFQGGAIEMIGGKIFSSSFVGGIAKRLSAVTGSDFMPNANTLLSSSLDNFKNLLIVGSEDIFAKSDDFSLSATNINFAITDSVPLL